MSVSDTIRQIVVARAGGACEYCRLVESACGVTFHVEHFASESQGGTSSLANLVLSCPGCNLSKGPRATGIDRNGVEQALYNPRAYEPSMLGWYLHFLLDSESGIVSGRTLTGEATVSALTMNSANRLYARQLQIRVGLING